MKKIITLLFFAGFLTSAFAQSGKHDHNTSQNGYGNQGGYSKSQSSSNSQWGNQGKDNSYAYGHQNGGGYNNDRDARDRDFGNRDDRYHDEFNRRGDHEGHDNYGKRNTDNDRKGSWFRFMFGRHER
jgi:hypothetical protein